MLPRALDMLAVAVQLPASAVAASARTELELDASASVMTAQRAHAKYLTRSPPLASMNEARVDR
jgi:hypothetical protein